MKRKKTKRFPLLIYRRWSKMLYLPSLLIAIVSGVSWWFARQSESLQDHAWFMLAIGAVGLLIFLYALWVRRAAYVQCTPNLIKIRTPFMPVVVSYARLLQVHPDEFYEQFPAEKQSRSHRRLVEPYQRNKAVVLELKDFPMKEKTLRLWLSRFMFATDTKGLVLLVEDWQTLSRQIDAFFDLWMTPHKLQQQRIQRFLRRQNLYS